jgi:hypothetical protein
MRCGSASTTLRRLGGVSILAFAATVALPALAEWEEDLAAQMRWDEDCQVQYYSGVIERVIDGNLVIIAKVHCDDGRTFDATQRNELEDFEIEECTPKEQAC